MLIAKITDLHLGFDQENPFELNRQRLDRLLAHLHDSPNRPDVLLATGDLTDKGDPTNYARVAAAFRSCEFPVFPAVGNHDRRDHFARYFPAFVSEAGGFVQYAHSIKGMRIIVLDTLEDGRHGGAFCERREAWLRAQLSAERDTPTLIAMHHPPVELGIDWMNTVSDEPWVKRFESALEGASQVKGIVCGMSTGLS